MSYERPRPAQRDLHGDEKKLYMRVRQTLWDYEPLRASHAEIGIAIDGQDVHLTGRTRTRPQKILAHLLASRVKEVGTVTSDVIADPEIVRSVADTLAASEVTAPYVIQVDCRHGAVILKGEVATEEVRQAAVALAARVPTVLAVQDRMTIGGPTHPPVAVSRHAIGASPDPHAGAVPASPTSAAVGA